MTNSRQKGARYEREIAQQLKDRHGLDARRGQQYSGANGDPDVVCPALGKYHLELKRRAKQISAAEMYGFLDQAIQDARPGQIPVVVHRIDGERSLATMDFDDWVSIAKEGDKDE